jgi:DNA invertase Pin-like site-specific DNA recombinase
VRAVTLHALHLPSTTLELYANGRHFRTLDGIVLDTGDDMCGELIFTVFAAIAKFQRQQIVKGTREALDAARA